MSENKPGLKPLNFFLIRSREHPAVVLLCTEYNVEKWIKAILDKGEEPQIQPITREQLDKMILPNPNLN